MPTLTQKSMRNNVEIKVGSESEGDWARPQTPNLQLAIHIAVALVPN